MKTNSNKIRLSDVLFCGTILIGSIAVLASDWNPYASDVVAPSKPVVEDVQYQVPAAKRSSEERMACIANYYKTSAYQSCMEDVTDVYKRGVMLEVGLEMCWEKFGKYEPVTDCG